MDQIQPFSKISLRKYHVDMCSAVIEEIHSAVNTFKKNGCQFGYVLPKDIVIFLKIAHTVGN